jgi:hypothetical protein
MCATPITIFVEVDMFAQPLLDLQIHKMLLGYPAKSMAIVAETVTSVLS